MLTVQNIWQKHDKFVVKNKITIKTNVGSRLEHFMIYNEKEDILSSNEGRQICFSSNFSSRL